MRIKSKQLWQYLSDTGAINGSEADIAQGKANYRRMYRAKWAREHKRSPKKELRPLFTLRQYMDLKVKADEIGLTPTKYIKELALASLEAKQIVPEKNILKHLLQLLTMAATSSNTNPMMLEAERILLLYLNKHGCY